MEMPNGNAMEISCFYAEKSRVLHYERVTVELQWIYKMHSTQIGEWFQLRFTRAL